MKVVILAGGFGTRISEESYYKPKPMIEIGDRPILWHIMKGYASYGFTDFIICLGYKQYVVKEYFAEYFLHTSDVTFVLDKNEMYVHNVMTEPWQVTLVDTGLNTLTGGRVKRVSSYIGNEPFFLTYGDGVSDVDIKKLLSFHKKHKKLITVTCVNVEQRFGLVSIEKSGEITSFREKDDSDKSLINAGFMVCQPEVLNYIDGDNTAFEKEPLVALSKEKQIMAYQHKGFWACMDTKRDKDRLEKLWESGNAPWKTW